MADKFEALEQQLEMFIENTRQLGIIVGDFQPQGQPVLNQKLNTMILGLQEIDKLRSPLQDIQIPLEVFEYVDNGKNPQLYTRDCMEKSLASNESIRGKIDHFKSFKSKLLTDLAVYFPQEINRYRSLREDRT